MNIKSLEIKWQVMTKNSPNNALVWDGLFRCAAPQLKRYVAERVTLNGYV